MPSFPMTSALDLRSIITKPVTIQQKEGLRIGQHGRKFLKPSPISHIPNPKS